MKKSIKTDDFSLSRCRGQLKMKASEVKVDMKEMKEFKEQNARDRRDFIDFWAEYVKTHKDEEWSRQQNVLINSQLFSARNTGK